LQSLNAELEEALQEKEDLKNQVQDYVVEVKRAEDLIASKVSTITLIFRIATLVLYRLKDYHLSK
jgi:3-hydroxyacyl-CoA dehydrogenase